MSTLLSALQSIDHLIDEAVNRKIRAGRLPPLGKLLSEIQHTAQMAVEDAQAAEPHPDMKCGVLTDCGSWWLAVHNPLTGQRRHIPLVSSHTAEALKAMGIPEIPAP